MCSTDAQCTTAAAPNCVFKECHASYNSQLNFIGFPDDAKLTDPSLLLKVCVADTGRGVDPDRFGAIFQPFEQGDASVARTHGGTGLGLAISRELARLMGGDLSVESRVGHGSRFTLSALLGRASAAAAPLRPRARAIASR